MSPLASSDGAPNAKQIVFLFMAATVVAVVVFLCGVLVGRGVPLTGRATTPSAVGLEHEDVPPATLGIPRSDPSAGSTVSEELSYDRILTGERIDLAAAPEPEAEEPTVFLTTEASGPDVSLVETEAPTGASAESLAQTSVRAGSPDGYYVQVVALRETHAVSGVVERLRSKGLPAIVVNPDTDAPIALYRVRVGPYESRAEAERGRQRIETEDEFAPFVTR